MSDTEIRRPEDSWPESETVVLAPPPAAPAATVVERPPDRRIGAGMLLAIVVLLLVAAGLALAWLLTHRSSSTHTNTVTVTTAAAKPTHAKAAVPAHVSSTANKPSTTPTTTAAPPQPVTATVPDVTQQPEAAAAQALGQAGIIASLTFVPSTDELGTVEAQAKQAGTTLPFHSHVQINVSTGPGQKPSERVPSVIGQPLQQALAAINGAQLRLIYLRFPVTDPSQAGNVVQQSPLGGGSAPRNAQVVVYLGALKQ